MKTKNIFSIAVLLILLTIYGSCRKSDRDKDTDLSGAKDNALAEKAVGSIFKSISEATDSLWQIRSSGYPTFSITPADTFTFPKTVTIDYGTTDCYAADGSLRRGVITATYSGKYRDSLTVITVSLTNYYFNDNAISAGVYTITNKGRNAAGHIVFAVNIQNANIGTTSGTINWNCTQNNEWIAGETTTTVFSDDVYSITGTENGRGISANTFTSIINSPLIISLNCADIEKGSFTLTPSNLSARIVDFGNGACDNQATVTLNGAVTSIAL